MATGVYIWMNHVNDKVYVGSASISFAKRRTQWESDLNCGRAKNAHLQAAWNKYGAAAFTFIEVEECEPDRCVEREQHWIDVYDAANPTKGYNVTPTAGSTRGRKLTPEHVEKTAKGNRGKIVSQETKDKIAAAIRLKYQEPGYNDRRIAGLNARRENDPEYVARLSKAIKAAKLKSPMTDEQRAQISASLEGQVQSEETRKKRSESLKKAWARRKSLQ